jgi:hypothetical protein
MNRDKSARRQATGWTVGALFPEGERDLSPLHVVQTGCGPHPASYPMGTGEFFLGGGGGEAAGAWNWPLTYI